MSIQYWSIGLTIVGVTNLYVITKDNKTFITLQDTPLQCMCAVKTTKPYNTTKYQTSRLLSYCLISNVPGHNC